jgi:hypothetical protein
VLDFRGLLLDEAASVAVVKHSLQLLRVAHMAADDDLALPEQQGKAEKKAATKARQKVQKAHKVQRKSTQDVLNAQDTRGLVTIRTLRELLEQPRQGHCASCSHLSSRLLTHPLMESAVSRHLAYLNFDAVDVTQLPQILSGIAQCDSTQSHLQPAIAASAQDGGVALPVDEAGIAVRMDQLRASGKAWDAGIELMLTKHTALLDKLIEPPPGKWTVRHSKQFAARGSLLLLLLQIWFWRRLPANFAKMDTSFNNCITDTWSCGMRRRGWWPAHAMTLHARTPA